MFLAAAVVGLIMYFFFFPTKFAKVAPEKDVENNHYCRDLIDTPDSAAVAFPGDSAKYKLIKQDVLVNADTFTDSEYHHYGSSRNYEDPQTKRKYVVRDPQHGGRFFGGGRSYKFASDLDPSQATDIRFGDYGLVFLFHADDTYTPLRTGLEVGGYSKSFGLFLVDIYKAVDKPPLPEWVLKCQDVPVSSGIEEALAEEQGASIVKNIGTSFYYPNPEKNWSPFKAEEQLAYFLFKRNKYIHHAWWTPHCKPAVYLYPQQEQQINVQVAIPYGSFLYTDPIYPTGGWNVRAKPNGALHYLGSDRADSTGKINYPSGVFPYLYYEARIHDSAIEKPTKGYVKKYEDIEKFYDEILPKLGLNSQETQEFKKYWLKALPKATYYFIGVVSQSNLNTIEPLTISPKQDTTIRVSLYFEALDTFTIIQPPTIQTPQRNGFTVVEWGGMVKRDKDHPFTCVQ